MAAGSAGRRTATGRNRLDGGRDRDVLPRQRRVRRGGQGRRRIRLAHLLGERRDGEVVNGVFSRQSGEVQWRNQEIETDGMRDRIVRLPLDGKSNLTDRLKRMINAVGGPWITAKLALA